MSTSSPVDSSVNLALYVDGGGCSARRRKGRRKSELVDGVDAAVDALGSFDGAVELPLTSNLKESRGAFEEKCHFKSLQIKKLNSTDM